MGAVVKDCWPWRVNENGVLSRVTPRNPFKTNKKLQPSVLEHACICH